MNQISIGNNHNVLLTTKELDVLRTPAKSNHYPGDRTFQSFADNCAEDETRSKVLSEMSKDTKKKILFSILERFQDTTHKCFGDVISPDRCFNIVIEGGSYLQITKKNFGKIVSAKNVQKAYKKLSKKVKASLLVQFVMYKIR